MNENYEKILQDYARDCDIRNFNGDTTSSYVSSIRFLGDFLHERGRGFENVNQIRSESRVPNVAQLLRRPELILRVPSL